MATDEPEGSELNPRQHQEPKTIVGISVAMCTYNGAAYLREQLDSLAAQECLPSELVVCDDCSTDDTVSILDEFAKNAPFSTRIVRNALNLGYRRNFAQAVQLCDEKLIALCDQDDIWYPQKLAVTVEGFQSNFEAEGFFSDGDLIGPSSERLGRTLWESFSFTEDDRARFDTGGAIDQLLRRNVVTGMAFAFRSSVKEMMVTIPETWIHDAWIAFLIAIRSKLVAYPMPLVGYRIHNLQQVGTSLSGKGKLGWIRERGLGAYLDEMRRRNLDEYQRTELQFEDLARFLRAQRQPDDIGLVAKVEARADYARRGAMALSLPRWRRWNVVFDQVGDHYRYSPTGLRAIPRDLFI